MRTRRNFSDAQRFLVFFADFVFSLVVSFPRPISKNINGLRHHAKFEGGGSFAEIRLFILRIQLFRKPKPLQSILIFILLEKCNSYVEAAAIMITILPQPLKIKI